MSIYQDVMSSQYASLSWKFKVNPENCENPTHYESYIRYDCHSDHKQGMGVTHVFVDENEITKEQRIAGYITLRSSSLIMDIGQDHKTGYPALEISELAVDKDYERQGIGTDMVKFAINQAVEMNEKSVGIQYVVLCADPKAVGFYSNSNIGFMKIRDRQDIPREGERNSNCEPMYFKIVENN